MGTINREQILAKAGHVAVLMGGDSAEREISLLSGEAVCASLRRLGVQTTAIDVDANLVAQLEAARPDLVFIALHGSKGEDGVVQGMLEMMNLPYTGSGVLASALAMDKVKCKLVWQQLGLPTADFVVLHESSNWEDIIQGFTKLVVKPVNGGSSLGIDIVDNADDLRQVYEAAKVYDSLVMAEQFIEGPEFSTGVLGDETLPSILLETDREFYDYEAKYIDAETRIICPVDLPEASLEKLEQTSRSAYDSLGCAGLARVDLIQDQQGRFQLLEINTIPGMTSHSIVPTAAARVGMDFDELMLRILNCELKDTK